MPECIDESLSKEALKRLPFLRGETCHLVLPLWVENVNVIVCHIQITGKDKWLLLILFELGQVLLEVYIPFLCSIF